MTILRCEYFDRKASAYCMGIDGNRIACEENSGVAEPDGTLSEYEIELGV